MPLTQQQIDALLVLHGRRLRGHVGDWSAYNEALHNAFPAILETLAEKDAEVEQAEKGGEWLADIQEGVIDELAAELHQANERVKELNERWDTRFNVLCGNCGRRYCGPRDEDQHGLGVCNTGEEPKQ